MPPRADYPWRGSTLLPSWQAAEANSLTPPRERSFLMYRTFGFFRPEHIAYGSLRLRLITATGLATFFFGFGAGALLNLYLLHIHSSLVVTLRSSLSYKSSILGDGILFPCLNMFAVSYLSRNRRHITPGLITAAIIIGVAVTTYFHVSQAVGGIVNWAMPTPWHWNILGAWHAVYMLTVSSLLALFYLSIIKVRRKNKSGVPEAAALTLGLAVFFLLLRLDYHSVNLLSMVPHGYGRGERTIAYAAAAIAHWTSRK